MTRILLAVVLVGLLFAGCVGSGSGKLDLDCGSDLEYRNAAFGYGFCYSPTWELTQAENGPIVALGTENLNVVARDQGWASLEEYKAANKAQLPSDARDVAEGETTLGGLPAWKVVWTREYSGATLRFEHTMAVRDGVGYILTYTANRDRFDSAYHEVELVRGSWQFGS